MKSVLLVMCSSAVVDAYWHANADGQQDSEWIEETSKPHEQVELDIELKGAERPEADAEIVAKVMSH